MTPTLTNLSRMEPKRRISTTWLTKSHNRMKSMMPTNMLMERLSLINLKM